MRVNLILGALLIALAGPLPAQAVNLVVATVDNAQMLQMQHLANLFEKANPDIHIRWVTLQEHALRQYVSADIATQSGRFDVVTIGMYELPIWAKRGWLNPIRPDAKNDESDLLPPIRKGLSFRGKLYAAPIYGESSILMYRRDLMSQAGLSMPDKPTWSEIATFAAKLNHPKQGVHGICLRGRPGWGENMTLVSTMVNAFGGQWFNMKWQPQLESRPWKEAVGLYVKLLNRYGPPEAEVKGYNANLSLFEEGKCGIWVGASVAAGYISDPNRSKVAHQVGFAAAPTAVTPKGSHWLWAWALAIPADIGGVRQAAAQKFVNWATSRAYIKLVAGHYGWSLVPAGTRYSTYANPQFQATAPWAKVELQAIRTADPDDSTLPRSPYIGIQSPAIPEFQSIGNKVGLLISKVLSGHLSLDQALARGQHFARRQMLLGGNLN